MFEFQEHKCYRMPAHFGGSDFDPSANAYYNDVTGLLYTIVTDGDMLSNYIPACFELTRPELTVQYQQFQQRWAWNDEIL